MTESLACTALRDEQFFVIFTGVFRMEFGPGPDGKNVPMLFTENESNYQRLYGIRNKARFVKDAFHDYVIKGNW